MYRLTILSLVFIFLIGCKSGDEKKQEEEDFSYETTKKTKETEKFVAPVDLSNKGIGPISELAFDKDVNDEMAKKGEALFNQKCQICHFADKRLVGPGMKGIYDKRDPAWVMNIMLNPAQMIKEDPIAKALVKEYNNAIMIDQNVTEEEARAMAEYFRTL